MARVTEMSCVNLLFDYDIIV